MKTPPNASVQKVCRTKGSGSSLCTDNGLKLGAPLPSSDWARGVRSPGAPHRKKVPLPRPCLPHSLPSAAHCHPEPATQASPREQWGLGTGVDLLYSRDAVTLRGQLPHTPQAANLGRAHYDHSQLSQEHDKGLEHVCPDDSLQPTLWGEGTYSRTTDISADPRRQQSL